MTHSSRGVDLILYGGEIRTLDPSNPRASAVAIRDGRIIAVGNDDVIRALADSATQLESLNGCFVLPGLTDAHIHLQGTTELLHQIDLFDVPSKHEALRRVADHAKTLPEGTWIQGSGWWQDRWDDKQFPTAADLDSVVPHHPVYLRTRSGHAAWVNTLALNIAGIDRDTPDPAGGQILRDEHGDATGILLEWAAMDLVKNTIPPLTAAQLAEQLKRTQNHLLKHGLTAVHDFDDQIVLKALQILREQGELHLRVHKHINKKFLASALDMGLHFGFGDDWLRIGALKLFADGALGPHTALMLEPYLDAPANYGLMVTPKDEMIELMCAASRAGLASTVHAIGDKAVRDVLDAYQTVRADESARGVPAHARRHRIEHVQIIHPDDVNRLAELSLIASMQPIHATSDYETADRCWGERSAFAYNPRLQLDRGVVVAFGSDSPYDILSPQQGIYAAVTRRRLDGSPSESGWYPQARISLEEALTAYTYGAAYAAALEDRAGKIAPGCFADLAVFDRPFLQDDPRSILEAHWLGTMVAGDWKARAD